MDFKELKNKTEKELQEMLAVSRDKLRDLRFKDSNKQLKNIREIRVLKHKIAQILTLLNKFILARPVKTKPLAVPAVKGIKEIKAVKPAKEIKIENKQ
jgi:ribosomal protein L29